MYISNRKITVQDIYHIVNYLDDKTIEEITKQIKEDDWQNEVIKKVMRAKEKYIVRLRSNDEPIITFGIIDLGDKIGGIFLLISKNIKGGNIITFLKGAKEQISVWDKKYKLILDKCYKKHKHIIKWLKLLDFKPTTRFETEDFRIYYRGDIKIYVE